MLIGRLARVFFVATVGATAPLIACGGGGAGPLTSAGEQDGGATGAGSGPAAGATEGGATSAAVGATSRHTPATGCHAGFTACGGTCADLQTDNRHCGACGQRCLQVVDAGSGTSAYTTCVDGACVVTPPTACRRLVCGAACVGYSGIDDCGACENHCADNELCVKQSCIGAKGDGLACKTALLIPSDEGVEFRYPPGLTDTHTFRCGSGAAVPTRWLKWTATRDQPMKFEIQGAPSTDDYILEAFDADACGDAAYLACNDDGAVGSKLPKLDLQVKGGVTYYVAVGRIAASSNVRPALRADD